MKKILNILIYMQNLNTFSIESYIYLHFTILGIVVTLVAITTTLTKEVRQDLIWKYYLKNPCVIVYYIFIIFSFVLTMLTYYYDIAISSTITPILLLIMFFATIIFIPYYLSTLKREWLYKKIYMEFENEFEEETEKQ